MPSQHKVLFFTTSLGGGGAESHMVRVVGSLDRSRFEPHIAVTRRGGSYEAFVPPDVPIHGVSFDRIPSSIGRVAASVPGLRRLVERERFELVCSVMDVANVAAIGALVHARPHPRHVLCVQIPPSIEHRRTSFGRALLRVIKATYPRADAIIALSHGVGRDLVALRPDLRPKVEVIHNACVDDRLLSVADDARAPLPATTRPVVLAVGRLTPQKDYPTLLRAFAGVRTTHDAELWILGDGPLRADIEAQIGALGLDGSVRLLGFQRQPQAFMRRATVFVLSSEYEGFGNVVVEALACGAPVVATDCPYGPSEILSDGETGLLVPVARPDAMAVAIRRLLDDEALRRRFAATGPVRARDFHADVIASAYSDAFERILAKRAS